MARDITRLHPFLQMLVGEFVSRCQKAGYNVKVTDCLRTKAEQEDCIKRGTSTVRYPYTMHAWGLAFDICQNDRKNPYPSDVKWWTAVGAIGRELGLTWGGDWTSPVDRPHFQLDCYGNTTQMVKKYGSPAAFFGHSDFNIKTPTWAITPKSSFKKILWLQIRLNIAGGRLKLDGIWGNETKKILQNFWMLHTGKKCSGEYVSLKCVRMLA